ncbi:uncharacterized protein SEPMUDRAFT_116168 [Sphaerulina musiva SO2202]|uniref:Uncharacterized protein n=1 Tax=Sphaerulina musiva (strain SO2202) TaxID=692275 RepID=M3D4G7_SPHMS|nr:uncharacterized protein SEPMUDRAFT_116168 [Sphaerulina musiva SO2202]EMF13105.1 hypothetical protein SEPMUDRAFT_116168 [Sphaerulina musiva SO2202]
MPYGHGGDQSPALPSVCGGLMITDANRLGDGIMDIRQYMACGSVWSMDKTYQFGCWGKINEILECQSTNTLAHFGAESEAGSPHPNDPILPDLEARATPTPAETAAETPPEAPTAPRG